MDLLVDVGNTRAKMAVVENKSLKEVLPLSSENVGRVLGKYSVERVIASVVGAMPDFGELLPQELCLGLHLLSADSSLPIRLDYATPKTLGADRIASVVGGQTVIKDTSLLVVDAGSCITLDYLDEEGVYRGGSIMPGIGMKFKAMNTFTEKLPLLDNVSGETALVGRSTEESMRSGVVCGTAFELQGFWAAYRAMDPKVRMILTGGDADQLAEAMGGDVLVDHNLLWRGLCEVLSRL